MMPQVFETVAALRARLDAERSEGRTIGFVPTMGALHEGHGSLVKAAVAECDLVVTSIFVNPTQFAPNEDLDRYPRPFESDREKLAAWGCRIVFHPSVEEMYPPGAVTRVSMSGLTEVLCGASRPHHFDGVLTVVAKLLNQVAPHRAYFGRKDYQQALVVRRMVADLDMPVAIRTCPIVREGDGLALSSRNAYLSADERAQALALRSAFLAMNAAFAAGSRSVSDLLASGRKEFEKRPMARIDYLEIRDPDTLEERRGDARPGDLVAVAAFLGKTRLIDNGLLGSD